MLVGYDKIEKVDPKTGKTRTIGAQVDLSGAIVLKPGFGISWFFNHANAPGRAGNFVLTFPKIMKKSLKKATEKLKNSKAAKAARVASAMIPDGVAMIVSDPMASIKCGLEVKPMVLIGISLVSNCH